MSDPWVLLTGAKGPTGTSLPASVAPVRRWCGKSNAGTAMLNANGGFQYQYNYFNYYPDQNPTAHNQLQAYRSPQGRVTVEGLVYAVTPDSGNVCTLPWDMLPNPQGNRVCTLADIGNAKARVDVYYTQAYGWTYERNASQAVGSNNFMGVHFSYQSHVPTCWVDKGCKTVLEASPYAQFYQYTVSPGQISGYLGGEPFTVVLPSVQTVQLSYMATPNVSQEVLFWYDVVNREFNHQMYDLTNLATYNIPPPAFNPSIWMRLAEEGKVVLLSHRPTYASTAADPATGPMDHRFFIRGPLDDFRGTP